MHKTRRNRHSLSKSLTIPQLKNAFDYIEKYGKGRPSVGDFQKEWKKVFGRPIEKDHADSYLKFIQTKPLRHYRGGNPGVFAGQGMIQGASDNGLRPYGVFQEYISSGFEVGIPAMSSQVMCEKGIVGPQGPAPTGMSGGRALRIMRRSTRKRNVSGGNFPQSSNPTSLLHDISTAWKGLPLPASPSAIDNPYLK
jgi:hypothetical protein